MVDGVNSFFNQNQEIKLQNRGPRSSGITYELKSVFEDLVSKGVIRDKDGKGLTKADALNLFNKLDSIHKNTNRATNYTSMQAGQSFTYSAAEMKALAEAAGYEVVSSPSQEPQDEAIDGGTLPEVVITGEKPKAKSIMPELSNPGDIEIEIPQEVNQAATESAIERQGGKIIEREVNGQKQQIAVVEIDGQKVRRAINQDGTLGENLVPISTFGKNKYITQTEMDNRIKNVFPEGLPEGVTASYVSIGGTPTLVFKKDGKTLDQTQLRELLKSSQDQSKGTVVGLNPDNLGISDIVSQPEILSSNMAKNEHPTGPNTPPPVYNEAVNPGDLQQAQIAADPLAGQQEHGPVIYQGQESMNVDSQGAAITGEYNYENDAIYQKMSNELATLEADITKFEQENGITQDDPLSESKAMFADGYRDYGTNKYLYSCLKQDYDSYKQVMDNWQDGVKSPSFRQSRNINGRTLINVNYTNIECITLKNGQRAYKTDQGVFYPYTNGYPGNVKVSEELIP